MDDLLLLIYHHYCCCKKKKIIIKFRDPAEIDGEAGNRDGRKKAPTMGIEDWGEEHLGWQGRGVGRHFSLGVFKERVGPG